MSYAPPNVPSDTSAPVQKRGLKIILHNMSWMIFQRGSSILLGLLATAWITRYLSPDQLGVLALATSLVTYFGLLGSGVDMGVMARMILHEPEREGALLGGTAVFLGILGTLVWFALLGFVYFMPSLDPLSKTITLIIGLKLLMVFPAPYAVWLYSQEQLKHLVLGNTFSALLLRLYQIGVVISGGNLVWIACAEIFSLFLNGFYCRWAYFRAGGGRIQWSYSWRDGAEVWKQSLPAILSASLFLLLLKLDVIMLKIFRGFTETGYFTAASTLSESLQFLVTLLSMPLGPRIMKAFKEDREKYEALKRLYFQLSGFISWGLAISLSLTSHWVVSFVYGAKYENSGPILAVHAFMLVPCFLGGAHLIFLVVEKKAKYMTLFLSLAMGCNLLSNWLLVPRFGGVGAGCSTVIALGFAYILMPLCFRSTRGLARVALRGLLFPFPNVRALLHHLSS